MQQKPRMVTVEHSVDGGETWGVIEVRANSSIVRKLSDHDVWNNTVGDLYRRIKR